MKKNPKKGLWAGVAFLMIVMGAMLGMACSHKEENDLLPYEEVIREYFSSDGVINVKKTTEYMEAYLESYEWSEEETETLIELPPSESVEALYETYRNLFTEDAYEWYFGEFPRFLEYKELMYWGEAVSEVKGCELQKEDDALTFSCDIACTYGDTTNEYTVGGSLWLDESGKINDIQVTSGLSMREDIIQYYRELIK